MGILLLQFILLTRLAQGTCSSEVGGASLMLLGTPRLPTANETTRQRLAWAVLSTSAHEMPR